MTAHQDGRQHLAFSLNGNAVSTVEDSEHPLTAAIIGAAAAVGPGDNTIAPLFDDIVVTMLE